jgi:threonine/homoserine/homoserine lactone efflux protein
VFYLSVFPQFVRPEHGSVLAQSITLGITQILVSFAVNFAIILSAARLAAWFGRNPLWLALQRWFMGLVLGGLAVRLALEQRRN